MASGNSLVAFGARAGVPAASNGARHSLRNSHPILLFDTTTQQEVEFTGVLPRHYGGGGITVYLHWTAASATSGTIGWDVSFERMSDATTNLGSDSFATAQTVTAATVAGTSGIMTVTNVAVTDGANIDGLTVGDSFRVRIRRDVANDTATGDAELHAVSLKET